MPVFIGYDQAERMVAALLDHAAGWRPDAVAAGTWAAVQGVPGGAALAAQVAALTMMEGYFYVVAAVTSRMYCLAGDKSAVVDVVAAATAQAAAVGGQGDVAAVTALRVDLGRADLVAGVVAAMVENGQAQAVGGVMGQSVRRPGGVRASARVLTHLVRGGKGRAAWTAAVEAGRQALWGPSTAVV